MNIKDFSQPTILKGTQYGTTITIELDHSDTSIDEVMDGFLTIAKGLGYLDSTINQWIKDKSMDIYEDEHEQVKEALSYEDDDCGCINYEIDNEEDNESAKDMGRVWTSPELEREVKEYFANVPKVNEEEKEPKPHYDWDEEITNERIDIIGQNGNEGTHYDEDELETPTDDYKGIYSSRPTYDWDNETNDILTNINDSITIIKDRMEDIDMRMDNIDEQLGILNADVANIEFNIQHPIKEALLNAKVVYDKSVIETERFNKVKEAAMRYSDEVKAKHVPIKDLDVVDMETGEVKNDMEVSYDEDGGFAVKMNKNKITKGKIKDLKK